MSILAGLAFEAGTCWFGSLQALAIQGLLEGALTCNLKSCEHCALGKETKVKFDTVIHRTKGLLNLVHMDVWGPIKIASLGGHQYFVSFVDDFSRHYWVYPVR